MISLPRSMISLPQYHVKEAVISMVFLVQFFFQFKEHFCSYSVVIFTYTYFQFFYTSRYLKNTNDLFFL
jgi:hypothetical protein